jgi:hypothetical protein
MTTVRHPWSLVLLLAATWVAGGCGEDRSTPTSNEGLATGDDAALDRGAALPFGAAQIYFELNATANDAGVQVFLDAEDWKRVAISDEGGSALLDIQTGGGMKELGLTELRFEGAEPDPSETLDAFPAGVYTFTGTTTDRQRLFATATLSHDLPAAPVFSPSHGEVVDPDEVEIEWELIAGVDRYQVIVETDANGFVLEVSVSSTTTSLQIPRTFLVPNTEYKAEVLGIAPNGNRTISEGTFVTGP